MKEITGDLWNPNISTGTVLCITTNGTIGAAGRAVMGRGCALEASLYYPGLPKYLGEHIKTHGNVFWVAEDFKYTGLAFFPTKHNWWEKSDLKLIEYSAGRLWVFATEEPETTWILPRPGCNNGGLKWEQVKPVIEFLPDNVWAISKG